MVLRNIHYRHRLSLTLEKKQLNASVITFAALFFHAHLVAVVKGCVCCVRVHRVFFNLRSKKIEQMTQLQIREDACSLCFDNAADVTLQPCEHRSVACCIVAFANCLNHEWKCRKIRRPDNRICCVSGVSACRAHYNYRTARCVASLFSVAHKDSKF